MLMFQLPDCSRYAPIIQVSHKFLELPLAAVTLVEEQSKPQHLSLSPTPQTPHKNTMSHHHHHQPPITTNSTTSTNKSKRATEPKWTFTLPKKRRDINGNAPSHPDYDPKTLLIPSSIYSTMSLGEQQYWDLKSHHMDKILFFKISKVFDLYEDDALIASREFGLEVKSSKNGGPNMFYCALPAKSLSEWKRKFVERGYKVAIAQEIAEKKETIHGTIYKRQVVEVVSPGLRDFEMLHGTHESANYLLSIREDLNSNRIGVCFVDVSTGSVYLELLHDDEQKTQLNMIIQQIVPSEIILPKKGYSKNLRKVIHALGKRDIVTEFQEGKEFLSTDDTERSFREASYFDQCPNYETWPEALQYYFSEKREPLVIEALGAILYYLKQVDRDVLVFSRRTFQRYNVQDSLQHMILDGQTLTNLEILTNNDDFSERGSLLEHMCQCYTAFGRRMFHYWLAHPLRSVEKINERLDAIDDFNTMQLDEELFESLKHLSDVERYLQAIHSFYMDYKRALNIRNANSMESLKKKAVTFYQTLDSLRKMCEFVMELDKLADEARDSGQYVKSMLLVKALGSRFEDHTFDEEVRWQQLHDIVAGLLESFSKSNIENATEDLIFVPRHYKEYHEATKKLKDSRDKLKQFIDNLQANWKTKKIKHKEKDLLEVPENITKLHTIPSTWKEKMKSRKTIIFSVGELGELDAQVTEAFENHKEQVCTLLFDLMKFFTETNSLWKQALDRVALIDCLFSLWRLSNYPDYTRPKFVDCTYEEPRVHIVQGRHPVIETVLDNYVPNSTYVGDYHPNTLLISGPNQGGKSCLLRQIATISIMAHVGSYVPAEECSLSAMDRIFTRIGANDRILKGESTFMVEMNETSTILSHATNKSLLILDELGSHTSTNDGYSIAYSVLRYLIEKTRSMTLFATHYHNLCREMEGDSRVKLLRMKFHSETDTPLFQLENGISPSSYGMRVARMAALPEEIISRAKQVSELFKHSVDIPEQSRDNDVLTAEEERLFFKLVLDTKGANDTELRELQQQALRSLYDMYNKDQ